MVNSESNLLHTSVEDTANSCYTKTKMITEALYAAKGDDIEMYNVILVDDEELILEGLKNCIQWNRYDFVVAGVFTDAQKALCYIEKENVDVLITDVKMPCMNGLDLISEVYTGEKDIKTVILSGYSEFEYARKALQYGASAYILKPTDDEAVYDVLNKIKKELDKKHNSNDKSNLWKDKLDLNKIVMENILRDLVLYRKNDKIDILKNYLNSDYYYLLVIEASHQNIFSNDIGEYFESCDIEKFIGSCKSIAFKHDNCNIVLLALQHEVEDKQAIHNFFGELKQFFCRFNEGMQIYGAWEGPAEGLESLATLFSSASVKMDYKYYSCNGLIETPDDIFSGKMDIQTLISNLDISSAAQRILIESDDKKATEEINFLIDKLKRKSYPDILIDQIPELIYIEFINYISGPDSESVSKAIQTNNVAIELYLEKNGPKTFENLKNRIHGITAMIKSEHMYKYASFENIVTNLAIKYISNNYTDEIKLEDISRHLAISVSHFCHIFKQVTGTSCIQFIIGYRLEKASEIIKTTETPVYMIAEKVGYKDSRYFLKHFKKRYGVSPMEMRRYYKSIENT